MIRSVLDYGGDVMTMDTETTLSSKGQVTIPLEMRHVLGLKPGQKMVVSMRENQEVVIRAKAADAPPLFGMFKAKRHVSIEEMSAESNP